MKTEIFNNKMTAIKNNFIKLISEKPSYRYLIFNNNNQGGNYTESANVLFDNNININYNIDDIFETSSNCDTTSDTAAATAAAAADVVTVDDIDIYFE